MSLAIRAIGFTASLFALTVAASPDPGRSPEPPVLTTPYDFGVARNSGANPYGPLAIGPNTGALYGVTREGGKNNLGTIFGIFPGGKVRTLVSFNGTNGSVPEAPLVAGADGSLYGTTALGGTYNLGTVFKLSSGNQLTTLASFDGSHGSRPESALVQGSDGNFYGTTYDGGPGNSGTIFRITPTGTLSMLASIPAPPYGYNAMPSGLIQASDGNFYGTTYWGGEYGLGQVFRVSPAGELSTIASFTMQTGGYSNNNLVEGTDGRLYGTVSEFGPDYFGSVFAMSLDGTISIVHAFDSTEYAYPSGPLIYDGHGNFYGAAYFPLGGNDTGGTDTLFFMTGQGQLTSVYAFPAVGASFTPAPGGIFGVTYNGGQANQGTAFEVPTTVLPSPRLPVQAPYVPAVSNGPCISATNDDLAGTVTFTNRCTSRIDYWACYGSPVNSSPSVCDPKSDYASFQTYTLASGQSAVHVVFPYPTQSITPYGVTLECEAGMAPFLAMPDRASPSGTPRLYCGTRMRESALRASVSW